MLFRSRVALARLFLQWNDVAERALRWYSQHLICDFDVRTKNLVLTWTLGNFGSEKSYTHVWLYQIDEFNVESRKNGSWIVVCWFCLLLALRRHSMGPLLTLYGKRDITSHPGFRTMIQWKVAANMPLNISHHGRRSRTCRRSSCQRFHLLVIEIFVDFHVYRYFRRNSQFN